MSYLLNRDTCRAWLRHNRFVQARCLQHGNELHVAAPMILDLALWLLRPRVPIRFQLGYQALMQNIQIVNLDRNLAERAALVGSRSARLGSRLSPMDMMVVATALETGLTLVTHDLQRFAPISNLKLVDWMVP